MEAHRWEKQSSAAEIDLRSKVDRIKKDDLFTIFPIFNIHEIQLDGRSRK